jgi:hypothetical protein
MGDRKKYDFVQKYLRITENTEEDILTEDMSLPIQKKTNYTNNTQQVVQPPQQYTQMPQLGISEAQISGKDLFKI